MQTKTKTTTYSHHIRIQIYSYKKQGQRDIPVCKPTKKTYAKIHESIRKFKLIYSCIFRAIDKGLKWDIKLVGYKSISI